MNEEYLTVAEKKIDQAFDQLPGEVADFMFSDAFKILINGIQKVLALTDEQTLQAKNAAFDLVLQLKTESEIAKEFLISGMSTQLTTKLLFALDSEILKRVENLTEFYTPETKEDVSLSNEKTKPSDAVAQSTAFGEALLKPSIIAPTKRDYSMERAPTTVAPVKKFDPYHEPVDTA